VSRSGIVIIGALVAIVAFALAAILFVGDNDAAQQRLGLFFGLVGTVTVSLIGLARADAAAKSTDAVSGIAQALNGGFEARVRHANRETAAESGTRQDVNRAEADAVTSARLSADPPTAPDPPVKAT
jgi:hypothetical protein